MTLEPKAGLGAGGARAGPLPRATAGAAVVKSVVRTARLLARRSLHLPTAHLGETVCFADGTSAQVFRETTTDHIAADPCVLVVEFRLRAIRGRGHALFRRESLLNTPLFAGFPGLVSKLWMSADQHGVYRGYYEWDSPELADHYARSLWRVLELVSVPGSIDFRIRPGLTRRRSLADLEPAPSAPAGAWWEPVAVAAPARARPRTGES